MTTGTFALHHVQLAMPPGAEEAARSYYGGLVGLAERLRAAGFEVRPDVAFGEHRRFHTDDCFGNRLEFLGSAGSP